MTNETKFDYDNFVGFKDRTKDQSVLYNSNGTFSTTKIFYENIRDNLDYKDKVLYTLKDKEFNGLPSAYQIYMHSVDETDAALKLVGSLVNWRRFTDTKWFMEGPAPNDIMFPGLKQWREDMRARDYSIAKSALLLKAKEGDTSAAKKLMDEFKLKKSVGRPIKPKEDHTKQEEDNISSIHRALLKRVK